MCVHAVSELITTPTLARPNLQDDRRVYLPTIRTAVRASEALGDFAEVKVVAPADKNSFGRAVHTLAGPSKLLHTRETWTARCKHVHCH